MADTLFSDGQLGVILAAFSGAGALTLSTIRWAVGRITTAMDKATSAQLETVKTMTEVKTKVDAIADWCEEHTPVEAPQPRASSRGGYGPGPPGRGG